jgi:hypothetical protein
MKGRIREKSTKATVWNTREGSEEGDMPPIGSAGPVSRGNSIVHEMML